MSDPALRAALFRFVDVRPACATPADVTRHLHELLDEAQRLPARPPRRLDHAAASSPPAPSPRSPPPASSRWPSASSSARTRRTRCRRSPACGSAASTPPSTCSARPRSPRPRPTATCSAARTRCARSPAPPRKYPARDVNLSVKVSALTPLLRPEAPERGIEGARPRLRHLLRVARDVRRPPARRHGVLRHPRGDHAPHARPAVRAGVRERPARRHRPAGLPRRVRPSTSTSCSAWAAEHPRGTRSRSAWSRAPTGTTRSSRPRSTAGRRRSSPTAASATATSRRSPSA